MKKIEISHPSLKVQKILLIRESYVELNDKYIRHVVDMDTEEPIDRSDLSLGWQFEKVQFIVTALKSQIVAIEKSWGTTNNKWMIVVFVNGLGGDIKLFFKTESKANETYTELFSYIFE